MVVAGQQLCITFPDVTNTQGKNEPVKVNLTPGIDGVEQVRCAQLPEPIAVLQPSQRAFIAFFQRKDVSRVHNQAPIVEGLCLFFSKPINVKGIAGDKVLKPLHRLCRTDESTGATARGIQLAGLLIHLPNGIASAGRTFGRHHVRL